MRVVSLLPAATEVVAALGATASLVGVSHECDWPPEIRSLPRVTQSNSDPSWSSAEIDRNPSRVTIDRDLLARLAPDIILGQSVCEVCAVGERELAGAVASLAHQPRTVTLHAHDLSGVFADIAKVGAALGLEGEAEELVAGLRYRLRRLTTPRGARPTVLVVEWVDPPYIAGHWVPELIAVAGGVDIGARPGDRSMTRPWSALRTLAPDVVVMALCGFDVARAQREVAAVTHPDARALLAQARVVFLDGNAYTSRPGPRLVEGTELLAQLISG